jgi:hypothetical protein
MDVRIRLASTIHSATAKDEAMQFEARLGSGWTLKLIAFVGRSIDGSTNGWT